MGTIVEEETHSRVPRPWDHLPKEVQDSILRHALLPEGTPALVVGNSSHHDHVQHNALPLLLAMGNWDAYIAAAEILYRHVQLVLFLFPAATMTFLTSPHTQRVRGLVRDLHVRMSLETDLFLFDAGWPCPTAAVAVGEDNNNNDNSNKNNPNPDLTPMNVTIPTALHTMRLYGRLRAITYQLVLPETVYHRSHHHPDLERGHERTVPSYYLPMARLQLGSWAPDPKAAAEGRSVADADASANAKAKAKANVQLCATRVSRASAPGVQVLAPAFLAGRAFQAGFLPLLEEGVFERVRVKLEVVSADGRKWSIGFDVGKLFAWLGTTVVEVLSHERAMECARGNWFDPFHIARQVGDEQAPVRVFDDDADPVALPRVEEEAKCSSHGDADMPDASESNAEVIETCEAVLYRPRGDDLLSSPIRYSSPSDASECCSREDELVDIDDLVATLAAEGEALGDESAPQQGLPLSPYGEDNMADDESEQSVSCNEIAAVNVVIDTPVVSTATKHTKLFGLTTTDQLALPQQHKAGPAPSALHNSDDATETETSGDGDSSDGATTDGEAATSRTSAPASSHKSTSPTKGDRGSRSSDSGSGTDSDGSSSLDDLPVSRSEAFVNKRSAQVASSIAARTTSRESIATVSTDVSTSSSDSDSSDASDEGDSSGEDASSSSDEEETSNPSSKNLSLNETAMNAGSTFCPVNLRTPNQRSLHQARKSTKATTTPSGNCQCGGTKRKAAHAADEQPRMSKGARRRANKRRRMREEQMQRSRDV